MRRYKILDGIFALHFINKPKSTEFEKFNINIHEDGRVLRTEYDVHANIQSKTPRDSARSRDSRLLQMMQLNENIKDQNLHLESGELPYFFVIFNIPEHLCRYGEPLACQFLDEDIEEKEHVPTFVAEVEEQQPQKRKYRNNRWIKDKKNADFQRRATPMPGSYKNSILMRRNLYRPSLEATIRLSLTRPSLLPGIVLQNFSLEDRVMTSREKDIMHQHCLPRLISSFMFPIDFKLEKLEEAESKRCNLYLRRQIKNEELDLMEPECFSYEKQEGPERLYPQFDKRMKVIYDKDLEFESDVKGSRLSSVEKQGKSLYSVLHTIQDIQEKYMERSSVFLEQNNYKPRFEASAKDISETNLQKSLYELEMHRSRNSKFNRRSTSSFRPSVDNSLMSGERYPYSTTESQQQHFAELSLRLSRQSTTIDDTELDDNPPKPNLVHVKHWTTKHIKNTIFDRKKLTITVKTDRLGLFGFAYKRYEHFPFRDWHLQQSEEK